MPRSSQWTPAEVKMLKEGFLMHRPIKSLAREMNRSPTALNKALSRFKIRERVRTLRPAGTRPYAPSYRRRRRYVEDFQLVSMEQVVIFMRSQGYEVRRRLLQINERFSLQYIINQRPVSGTKLLVMANQLRLEAQAPIFVVEHIDASG